MKFILNHIIPISVVLAVAWGIYIAEFILKRRAAKMTDTVKEKTAKRIGVLSAVGVFLHFDLCAYLLIVGGEISHVLPILLLSLIGALL